METYNKLEEEAKVFEKIKLSICNLSNAIENGNLEGAAREIKALQEWNKKKALNEMQITNLTSNETEGIRYDIESNKRALHRTQSDIKNLQERFESSDDIEPDQYKRRMRELRQHEEIYKKRISECNHAASNIPANTYTPEQIRDILSRIKPILEKSDVVELRALMHLMIDRIEIDPKTRSVDTIKIKFNKELTEYLCIGEEGASREASSFLLQKNIDEIMFELKVG